MNAMSRIPLMSVVAVGLTACAFGNVRGEEADAKLPPPAKIDVDFERHVRPLFAAHCLKCHGAEKQESGFRLDDGKAALAGGELGEAIVPGDSAKSPLIHYIAGTDENITMPPEDPKLSAEEVGVLRAWIDQGAKFPAAAAGPAKPAKKPASEHWAFRRPIRAEIPKVRDSAWVRNPIDAFVLARLERAGLAPAQEADRYTLIRRLSLDLTGLPPSVPEINAFVNDGAPDSYEKLVDRLLASPHYGERWALWWLDAARYADTNGYEVDRPRSIWPYRDWVIGALNADMSFQQFAIEQMAGDMLPGATREQRIATGFHRNTFANEEGGHNWEQFRWESIVDRVHTTSTAFLGLTMACAQCHDHKYDPISQREYYAFFAFLNSADEPHVEATQQDIAAEREALAANVKQLEERLETEFPDHERELAWTDWSRGASGAEAASKLEKWCAEASARARDWVVLEPLCWTTKNNSTLSKLDDGSLLASGDRPEIDQYDVSYRLPPGRRLTGLKLEALPHESLPEGGPGRGSVMEDGSFLLSEFVVSARHGESETNNSGSDKSRTAVALTHPTASYAYKGQTIDLTLDGDKLTGWHVRGGVGRRHVAVYELVNPLDTDQASGLDVVLLQNFLHQQTLGRFRLWATDGAAPLEASDLPVGIEATLAKPRSEWTDADRLELKRYYVTVAPELKSQQEQIAKLRGRMPRQPTSLVLEERATPRVTHQHIRGDFARPGKEVVPDVPAFLHPLDPALPRNRLTLARWLVDEQNPLVGRVIVNQIWQAYFGRGLVTTPEDFGFQGTAPTHPELLDWLACEFMDRGWSLKQLHKVIVTSATYRQSSATTQDKLRIDPENALVSRGPRFRLPAEFIRDGALSASGLLSPKIGGPSVFPPQPEGVSELSYGGFRWPTSSGENRYRRGLYTHRKRGAPYAAFAAFDAPPQHTCTVRRVRSNTPLQALALLNDAAVIEASQAMARRILKEAPSDDDARLDYASQLCLSRLPSDAERVKLQDYRRQALATFERRLDEAAHVAGDVKQGDAQAPQLASWAVVARVLLNLDESMTKE